MDAVKRDVGKLEGTSGTVCCHWIPSERRGEVFIKFVARKVGRWEERSEDIIEIGACCRREGTNRACYGIKTCLEPKIQECAGRLGLVLCALMTNTVTLNVDQDVDWPWSTDATQAEARQSVWETTVVLG